MEPYLKAMRRDIVFGFCTVSIGAYLLGLRWEQKRIIAATAAVVGISLVPKIAVDVRDFIRAHRH